MKAKDTNKIQLLGLMSGTSLDGLDIAQVEFEFHTNQNPVSQIINTRTLPYPGASNGLLLVNSIRLQIIPTLIICNVETLTSIQSLSTLLILPIL